MGEMMMSGAMMNAGNGTRAKLACGSRGRFVTVDYPNLVMAPQPLGAVHVRICVVAGDGPSDGGPPPDATLWVQS